MATATSSKRSTVDKTISEREQLPQRTNKLLMPAMFVVQLMV